MDTGVSLPGAVFDGWNIESVLGEGAFGKVYLAERTEFGVTYQTAIKHIGIPKNDAELSSLRSDGDYTGAVLGDYFDDIAEQYIKEIRLMYELKGNTNIVSYEDHKVIKRKTAVGYDIFIRMEKLESVSEAISRRELTQSDVVTLGMDICRALEVLSKRNLIHRDIKMGNLFINKNGDYKLGDFGIARQIDTNMSMKSGTIKFMSPEVFKGQRYDATADIYSLGIVMYRLLNANRSPFLPLSHERVRLTDEEKALSRRMAGEEMPRPAYADEALSRIVLKACAFDPRQRFQSASEFLAILQHYADGTPARVLPVISSDEPARDKSERTSSASVSATGGVFGTGFIDKSRSVREESVTGGVFTGSAPLDIPTYSSRTPDETAGVFSHSAYSPRAFDAERSESPTEGVFGRSETGTDYTGGIGPEPSRVHTRASAGKLDLTENDPVEYGGYLFVCDRESDYCLYRTNLRTRDREMLSDGACKGFVIDNGQIYYASASGIYKVFFNKNQPQLVTGDDAAFPVFAGGFIYYANRSAGGAVYRVKHNGNDRVIVSQGNAWYLALYGRQLFYSDASDGYSLCSVDLDGFQEYRYGIRGCHYVRADRGFVVFSHGESNGAVCRLNVRTKEMARLNNEPSVITSVRSGWVYYRTDDYGAVQQLRLDGADK